MPINVTVSGLDTEVNITRDDPSSVPVDTYLALRGLQGEKGDKGDPGASGLPGADGKSAYESAVDGGYSGTEEEFEEKLAADIPKKTSDLINDSGFLTEAPVSSVNGQTGAVTITEGLAPLIGTTSTVTPQQVMTALEEGRDICITATSAFPIAIVQLPIELKFTAWERITDTTNGNYGQFADVVVSQCMYNLACWTIVGGVYQGQPLAWTINYNGLVSDSLSINGHLLEEGSVVLTASDVGALPSSTVIPSKTSDLANDSGYISSETDPTVPSWAKASSKPSYNFSEIGSKPNSISGYGITDAYTKTQIDGLVSGVLHYKGTKATTTQLPASGNVVGDTWHITADGSEWAWDGSAWQELGTAVDLSSYALKTEIPTVPSNVGAFTNDVGYLTSFTETDPTVPSWAKAQTKPTYTASEVGALSGNAGGVFYGTCATAAKTVNKVVECTDFTADNLKAGTIILVSFSATNSGAVASLTMNVNGTGAKPIKYINNGALGNLASAGYIKAGTEYPFYYDGTNWVVWFNYNTTYSTMSETEMETGTATSNRVITAARLKEAVEYHALLTDITVDGESVVNNKVAEIALTEKIDEIVSNIVALEKYYLKYLPSKVAEINAAIEANPDVSTLLLFTDYHHLYQDQSEGNAGGIGDILKYIAKRTPVKDMAFLGDALSYENNSDKVDESINSFLAEVTSMDRMMIVKGNHDLNPYGTPKLTNQQYIDRVMSAMDGNYGIEISDKTWYYRDDTENMVRYIVLDSRETSMDYDYANGDATEKAYITAEAQFFGNALLSMPSGYMAVVLTHAQWWGTSDTSVTIYSASNQEPVKMMKAYNSRGSYSGLGVSFNFSSGVGTAPVMWVGHAHKDFSQMFGSVLCVSTSADSWAFANARPDYVTHTKGAITEHVADCLLIDRTAGTMDTIRIGAGKNRHFVLGQGQECNVSNSLVNCSTSNAATKAYSTYSATLTADSGCEFDSVVVTVGGFDVSANYVTMGTDTATISIPNVPQDIVVTAHASVAQGYTNLIPLSQEVTSTAIFNNGLGYKNGYYMSGDNQSANANDCMTGCIPYVIATSAGQPTDVLYIKGYTGGTNASHTRMQGRNSSKAGVTAFNGFLNNNGFFDVETLGTGYYKLTPKANVHTSYADIAWLQFSFHQADASGIIITKNEPIE